MTTFESLEHGDSESVKSGAGESVSSTTRAREGAGVQTRDGARDRTGARTRQGELTADVERELISKCRAGQARFYEPLVRAYEGPGMRVAMGMMRDEDAAHDALQETFVKVYRKLGQFDVNRTFGPWFFQILRNQCRDMLRSRKARAKHIGHDERLEQRPADDRWNPGRRMERTDAKRILWEGLDRVGDEHREILVLKELEDFRYHEIAKILEIPEGTVASRLYHARRALRDELEELGYAGVGS